MYDRPTNKIIDKDGESEKDISHTNQGGPVNILILKSFRTHVAFFIIKKEVSYF